MFFSNWLFFEKQETKSHYDCCQSNEKGKPFKSNERLLKYFYVQFSIEITARGSENIYLLQKSTEFRGINRLYPTNVPANMAIWGC